MPPKFDPSEVKVGLATIHCIPRQRNDRGWHGMVHSIGPMSSPIAGRLYRERMLLTMCLVPSSRSLASDRTDIRSIRLMVTRSIHPNHLLNVMTCLSPSRKFFARRITRTRPHIPLQIIYLRATGGEVGASSALAPKIGPLGLVSATSRLEATNFGASVSWRTRSGTGASGRWRRLLVG
jgi:hypothetical protein